MFLGEYKHTIDEKGRMILPACFRDLLQGGAYVSLGFDNNLIVWPITSFEQILVHLSSLSVTDSNTRLLRRMFFSQAARVDFDRSGRILLPQALRSAVNLQENAIITGVGDTLEIWSEELWAAQEQLIKDGKVNSDRFTKLELPIK